jgi:cell division protein FtsB
MIFAAFLICMVLILFFGIMLSIAEDEGLFDGLRKTPKKIKALEKENAQLRAENEQLNIELTAHRLQLPWWVEQEKDGTQE